MPLRVQPFNPRPKFLRPAGSEVKRRKRRAPHSGEFPGFQCGKGGGADLSVLAERLVIDNLGCNSALRIHGLAHPDTLTRRVGGSPYSHTGNFTDT
jgi:hypothetical protein